MAKKRKDSDDKKKIADGQEQSVQTSDGPAPAEENPTEESPADESSTDESPADETPAEESPADENTADETPAEETPAVETPAEESPADETPAEESPADENTADETPAEESPIVESPAEESLSEVEQASAKPGKKKLGRWVIPAAILGVLLIAGGIFAWRVMGDPRSLFNNTMTPPPTPTAAAEQAPEEPAEPTPEPTLSPYEQLQLAADADLMKDIVNVLIIGVDYAEERETWEGKHAYHSDVMMVLAVNFKENTADLISLPRDTYAEIPGVKGIYKLNASIDCGGGFPEGLTKVCESASWMLGGIPVDYYYAVTMPVVKDLVDAIGGVDYDVDVEFSMAGRDYQTGMQHMDGQAVLDYLRVRKNVKQAGDLNRINRQKMMMVAIFRTMKQKNLIVSIPDLVKAFEGQMLTNTTLEQTAALALFAYGLDEADIGMYSMGGKMYDIFNWNFCLTDQANRVKIIEEIYGIEVPQNKKYGKDKAMGRWNDMRMEKYVDEAGKLLTAAENTLANTVDAQKQASLTAGIALVKSCLPPTDEKELEKLSSEELYKLLNALGEAMESLSKTAGVKIRIDIKYEKDYNEVLVDFR